ncbi:keratin%2C type I cytoskeletal 13-like [Xyrichtys novacula]|uniref:Keratin, type I cytoskeletal 13-like n=1 Tax=Xyrichtys novacula TaxID=13765 RepID=A0AAV1GPQ7_XYRNO|nr:keratin%2C type I cytoskeletal 13-like [Xyrichtys novacula]
MTMIMQRSSMLGGSMAGGSFGGGFGGGLGIGLGGGAGRMSSLSMAGGAGGSGVRVSSASKSFSMGGGGGLGFGGGAGLGFGGGGGGGFAFGGGAGGGDDGGAVTGKFAMQNLNDRLATYLAKVKALESANAALELKIRQFVESKVGPSTRDFSAFYVTIAEIQGKIQEAIITKATVLLAIDNAKLAQDDFRVKFENELSMRQSVEADIAGLKMLLGELGVAKTDLAMQIELTTEEMLSMKKNHEEDLVAMRSQMSGQVNVEVDAAPQGDIIKVLEEMREYYETVTAKSTKELEGWFQAKCEAHSQEVAMATASVVVSSTTEVKESKSALQAMEIELQSQLSMKASLEASLFDIQSRYSLMMSSFQSQVGSMEGQLVALKADLERQAGEYQMLLDIKTRLEMEIAEYRRLLDGEGGGSMKSSVVTTTKTITSSGGGLGGAVSVDAGAAAAAAATAAASLSIDSSISSSSTTTTTIQVVETQETITA